MGDSSVQFSALIEVRLRPGIADPEGATIERALPALGFEGIHGLRVGKAVRCTVDADDEGQARTRLEQVCERFLANPVIEEVAISLDLPAGASR